MTLRNLRYIYQILKTHLRNFLIRILNQLDESFSTNLKLQHQSVSSSHQLTKNIHLGTQSIAPQEPINPIILNENGSIFSFTLVRTYAEAIFETRILSPMQEDAVQYVLTHAEYLGSYARLMLGLKKYFYQHVENNDCPNYEVLDSLKYLSKNVRDTHENSTCYKTEGKTNSNAVFWPDPTTNHRSLFTELPFAKEYKCLNKTIPIGSAGSCFAIEIAQKLQSEGYNYVVTEKNTYEKTGLAMSCARWGTIFNTPSFRQLVERAFGHLQTPPLLWSMHHDGNLKYYDPYREDIIFNSIEEYQDNYHQHIASVKEALLTCKVFVLTLGMNEVWQHRASGSVFSRAPWRIAPSLVKRIVMSVEENLIELQQMLSLWRTYNPDIKLIVSVSPVPLHATFRAKDNHVVTANALSKATLRVVAEQFCSRNKDVYYFPSYETVMYCTENAWESDQRHVSQTAISNVMRLFDQMFCMHNFS